MDLRGLSAAASLKQSGSEIINEQVYISAALGQ